MAITLTEIQAILRLRDELTGQLKAVAGSLAETGSKLERIGTKLKTVGTNMTLAVTGPLVAAGAEAFKFSSDFQTVMTKVGNLTDIGTENVGTMRKAIMDLAPAVGIGPTALGEGLLVVASTGLKGAEALDVLKQSARASAVGLGETKDIARAMTAAIVAYGSENISAAQAANKLFAAVREGGAEADEFAGSLGRVIGVASQVGVSFDELLASVATFTRLGVDADEAVTALRGTMSVLLKPSKQAREELVALGTSIEELRKSVKEKGLMQALTELVERTNGNDDALAHVIPNVRALAGVMSNAGAQAEAYASNLKAIQNATTDLDDAFKEVEKTLGFKWNAAWAKAQTVLIQFGDTLSPSFTKVLDAMGPLLDKVAAVVKWFASLPSDVQQTIVAFFAVAAAIGPVVFAFGTLSSAIGGLLSLLPLLGVGLAATAGPIGLVIAAIAGLTYAVIHYNSEIDRLTSGKSKDGQYFTETGKKAEEMTEKARALEAAAPPLYAGMKIVIKGMQETAPAAEHAAAKIVTLTDELKNVQKAVDALTPAQRKNIESGVALGKSVDDISKATGIAADVVDMYTDRVKTSAKTIGELASIQREAFSDKFTAWWVTMKANATGFLEGIEKVGDQVDDIEKLKEKFKELDDVIRKSMLVVQGIKIPVTLGITAMEAVDTLPKHLDAGTLPQSMQIVVPKVTSTLGDMRVMAKGAKDDISNLAQAFGTFAQIVDGKLGGIVGDIGKGIGAFNLMQQSIATLATKGVSDIARLGAAFSTFAAAVGIGEIIAQIPGVEAASNWLSGGALKKVQDIVKNANKAFEPVNAAFAKLGVKDMDALAKKAAEAGISLDALWAAIARRNLPDIARELEAVNNEFDRQKRITDGMHRFGPTKAELQQLAQDAHDVFDAMVKDGGYSADQLEKAFVAFQEALAAAGNEAAKQWLAARTASTDAFKAAEKDLQDLLAKRDSLMQSISAEAPEEVMGVIEAQQRGELKALDAQIKDKADAYAKLARETGQTMADEIVKALRAMHIDPVHVQVVLDGMPSSSFIPIGPSFNPESPEDVAGVMEAQARAAMARAIAGLGQADGGDYMVNKPTLFIAGEAGPERATFTPAGQIQPQAQQTAARRGPTVVNLIFADGGVFATATLDEIEDGGTTYARVKNMVTQMVGS